MAANVCSFLLHLVTTSTPSCWNTTTFRIMGLVSLKLIRYIDPDLVNKHEGGHPLSSTSLSFTSQTVTLQEQSVFVLRTNSSGTKGKFLLNKLGNNIQSNLGARMTLHNWVGTTS